MYIYNKNLWRDSSIVKRTVTPQLLLQEYLLALSFSGVLSLFFCILREKKKFDCNIGLGPFTGEKRERDRSVWIQLFVYSCFCACEWGGRYLTRVDMVNLRIVWRVTRELSSLQADKLIFLGKELGRYMWVLILIIRILK